jgi:hypothetical protein
LFFQTEKLRPCGALLNDVASSQLFLSSHKPKGKTMTSAMTMDKPQIAIIGAGFAGLTLANYLHDRSIGYVLFESKQEEPNYFVANFALPSGKDVFRAIGLVWKCSHSTVPCNEILDSLRERITILNSSIVKIENGLLVDQQGGRHGPFRIIVAANGVKSTFRMFNQDNVNEKVNVLLIGDARWAADVWWDFGLTRVSKGANTAMQDAIKLGAELLLQEEGNFKAFSARQKRREIVTRRRIILMILSVLLALGLKHSRLFE